jgi:hypothetical protein
MRQPRPGAALHALLDSAHSSTPVLAPEPA